MQVGALQMQPVSTDLCLPGEETYFDWPLSGPLAFQTGRFPVVLAGDHGEVLLTADLENVRLETEDETLTGVKIVARGNEVALPGFAVRAREVALLARFDDFSNVSANWALENAYVEDLSSLPRFKRLRLVGDGTASPQTVQFDLLASDAGSLTLLSSLVGQYDIAKGAGNATAMIGPLSFSERGMQPQQLVPSLVGVLTNVVGSVQGVGRFGFRNGKLSSSATIQLDDIGLSTATARIEGVNGKIAFDNLMPPVTAPGQTLAVKLIDAGFQLMDGTVAFAVSRSGAVQIEKAHWPFAGGSIVLSSGVIEPGTTTQDLVLDVEAVDLGALISLLSLDGVSGSGLVSGRVPLSIRDGDPIITGGRLTTEGPGALSYIGEGTGAIGEGQSALLFKALENFQYTGLTLSLDGNAQDRLNVKLSLQGANPALYDGYPFAININTEASFAELLRSATLGTNALDIIRQNGAVKP